MRAILVLLPLALVACTSPRAACERDALHDLRVMDALIAETEQTLARGYALQREPVTRPRLQVCYGAPLDDNRVGMTLCNRSETTYRERPVAVDLGAERRKLTSLQAKRQDLARSAARRLAACRKTYPEG
ncbi:hypothetical protein [Rhodovulum adriaticum]|uniref:UrcA family protein n=1 Tax=Rhodovulum adriaticum TaxID=35804 RepID=A0A4R2NKG0_RHOAD|nr:hypothetical protein [Rhodovulum adriaticum]MBK1636772.1 hypothetical protein [Rhodovulum adriaticum]TCP21755.1 hypothetical protein EV656_1097 [Rhodovulum adriaticum]